MIKRLILAKNLTVCALSLMITVSCGIMEIDDSVPKTSVNMQLERDTVYVMQGDTFSIRAIFTPDSISNKEIFWISEYDSIVHVSNNSLVATGKGWTSVVGMSMSWQKNDTCQVCVIPTWDYIVPVFPYETVFYADVTVDGQPFNPATMRLLAYVNNEVRGVGEMKEHNGVTYMCIRVGMENFDEYDPSDEIIRFFVDDRYGYTRRKAHELELFDGATHGVLGNLYSITVD